MIVYGKQIVLYVLEKHPELVEEVFLSKEIDKKLFTQFARLNKKIHKVDNQKAQALAKGGNHQGLILKLSDYSYTAIKDLKNMNFIVVLDGLTDVGNIGAIARTCYSLGIDGLIAADIKTVNNSGTIRTSAGALLDLPFAIHPKSVDLASELKDAGFALIGATMDGTDLKKYGKIEKTDKVALFLGNEGEGISPKVTKKLDLKVSIKMEKEFDSLNVSAAAAILIYNLKK
ncbi:putative TrmH family tRNA/rRNA methyltransferase [Aliarcobacter thereius]|uniref:23S rRNA (Guanosine(2251)-2'-O)-methyltransferase RlmB n=1 Tax=Aliarcobacter thereius TaxID=544718 RepID=A0A1C0B9Y6_9BACT|nr:23S rRNA (guanosine(2251)-2'-O)-methyltransferase RlmB [Aliarcobacter thereius]OCL88454.1 putative TrmH family tRNA/rRNA methyltransferase [Aliarcobacter thereius]OCL91944.1 putative TrmH family tRNA/rRNA methyltransferase [Aliarcobacter thereius]OCM00406.1 putative TrmH family tRNA/rRNA methyltransferase [Aliarcobacter thereius]TLS72609.1 23S rRNA (guanosine(2251)-2'-O)-methyltransferase RlmB [Aliarcobacter thereius]HJE02657.1 23S rRNA (guanosine(2251)-2'-O)-methyltransferase RlmB [Aliarco